MRSTPTHCLSRAQGFISSLIDVKAETHSLVGLADCARTAGMAAHNLPLQFSVPFICGPQDFPLLIFKFCCAFNRLFLTSSPAFLCFVGEEGFRYPV